MPTGPSVPQPWSEDLATALIEQHRGLRGPLLPVLRALQEAFGAIDPRAVPIVAQMLNLSRAEVHGVVTFYRDFRSVPAAPTRVSVCRAEACQSMERPDSSGMPSDGSASGWARPPRTGR